MSCFLRSFKQSSLITAQLKKTKIIRCPFIGSPSKVELHEVSYCTPLYTQIAHYKTLSNQSHPSHHINSIAPSPIHLPESNTLRTQIARLQSDLLRVQEELSSEKRLRTERLRQASERCLALMSLSEQGEGKVEILRMQARAERELRERTEEELDRCRMKLAEYEE